MISAAMNVISLLAAALVIYAVLSASAEDLTCRSSFETPARTWSDFRFSKDAFYPLHYDLFFRVDLREDVFHGTASITINNTGFSDYFVLNADSLNVTSTRVFDLSRSSELVVHVNEPNQLLVIEMEDEADPGTYLINASFSGFFSSKPVGLYKIDYTTDTNKTKFTSATNFAPNFARKAFPCVDDPGFKATFKVTLQHESQWTALSNMPVNEISEMENGFTTTTFAESPPMSPHSVGFSFGEFAHLTIMDGDGATVQVYDSSEDLEMAVYSMNFAKEVMKFYESYFEQNFPLPKLDIIVLSPEYPLVTYWGLTTVKDLQSSESQKDTSSVAERLCKVMAKMWIGHLVSASSPEEQDLLEALAEFVSWKALQHFQPTSDVEEDFVADTLAFFRHSEDRDSFCKTGSKKCADRKLLFKICLVFLRFLEDSLEDEFQRGIANVFKKFQYGNIKSQDLWNELSSEPDFDAQQLFEEATRTQKVYPIINVRRDENCTRRIILEQRHVLLLPERARVNVSAFGFSGQVITYYTSSDRRKQSTLMDFYIKNLEIDEFDWIKMNVNFIGFYITNYEMDVWKQLIEQMKMDHTVFTPSDRASLLHDSFALAESGLVPWAVFLELSTYLRRETELAPWKTALSAFRRMELWQEKYAYGEPLQEFVLSLCKHLHRQSMWNYNQNREIRELSSLVTDIYCRYGHRGCLQRARQVFLSADQGAEPPFRHLAFMYGSHGVGEDEESSWNRSWSEYVLETNRQKKLGWLRGLAASRNTAKLQKLIGLINEDARFSDDELLRAIRLISQNQRARELWCTNNFNHSRLLVTRSFDAEQSGVVLEILASTCRTKDFSRIVDNIAKNLWKDDDISSHVQSAFRIAKTNELLFQKNQALVEQWLTTHQETPWTSDRLPRSVVPSTYDLRLEVALNSKRFRGNETITVDVSEPISCLIVNSENLEVTSSEVISATTSEPVRIEDEFPFARNGYWVIRFEQPLLGGTYLLRFRFIGWYTNRLNGFNRHFYSNNGTESRPFVYTKLQPAYARKVFPCFDEPDFKATFRLTAVHDSKYFALSNMPEEISFSRDDGLTETRFLESLKMSSYLVSLVVCDFAYTETELISGQKVRYFAQKDRVNDTKHSVERIPEVVQKMAEIYDTPFSYPKLDFIAFPQYRSCGTENWGLIYITDGALVSKNFDAEDILRSDYLLAHEIAHHWFGNLVTLHWWSDSWLNEGLADLASYHVMRHIHPEETEQLYMERKTMSIFMDGRYELVAQIRTNNIRYLLQPLSYRKGFSIGLMLQKLLNESFFVGVSNYLRKYSYGNTRTEDLWNELSSVKKTDIDIFQVMDNWMHRKGYPFVEITRNATTFTAKQRPCAEAEKAGQHSTIWSIPLTYRNMNTRREYLHWLNEKEATFPIEASAEECVRFNAELMAYYITIYSDRDYDLLSKALEKNHEIFSASDRHCLLFEARHSADNHMRSYKPFLKLTRYLRHERTRLPWKTLYEFTSNTFQRYFDKKEETYVLWKKYLVYLTEEFYRDAEFPEHYSKYMKDDIHYLASCGGSHEWIKLNFHQLENWLRGNSTKPKVVDQILPHVRNASIWNEMWAQYQRLNSSSEGRRRDLLSALIRYDDETLLRRTFAEIVAREDMSRHDYIVVFETFRQTPHGSKLLWEYLKEHPNSALIKIGNERMPVLIRQLCEKIWKQEEVKYARKISKCYGTIISSDVLKKCMDEIQGNIKWRNAHAKVIHEWLESEAPISLPLM